MRVAVVIPAFNETTTIRQVAAGALAQADRVIVVDDGSTDGTGAALAGLPLTLLTQPCNSGKAAALWRGMRCALEAGADAIVTLDGDGQHQPADIPRLLAAHRPDRVVVGARLHERARIPTARYRANRFANFWIAWAAGCPVADSQSGFRVYPAALLRTLAPRTHRAAGFVFESEVLIAAGRRGLKIVAVPVAAIYQPGARASHFRPVADIARIVRMVAWQLVSRGLCLPGLVRSLRRDTADRATARPDGGSRRLG